MVKLDATQIAEALANANLRAFLVVIRAGEGTTDFDGYRRCYGGSLFDSYADHPRRKITAGRYTSTAAGAYQILARTWDGLVAQYGFPDFSAPSQDEAAVALIAGRKALDDVIAGRVQSAIRKCNLEWASLPGSPYGQPTRTMAQALATYAAAGGVLEPAAHSGATAAQTAPPAPAAAPAPTTAPQPRKDFAMPPFLFAALPALIQSIPSLAQLFGARGEAAEQKVAAVQQVAQIAKDALGARNEQEMVETLAADPEAVATVREAIEARWFEIAEAGGGGIAAAREADVKFVERIGGFWRSPSFAAMAVLAPLVYMIVGSVAGLWGYTGWSDDVRAAIATAVVSLVVGGAAGFYWGSTTGSSKKGPAK